jgi:sugar phosphate isomerase/epimerase
MNSPTSSSRRVFLKSTGAVAMGAALASCVDPAAGSAASRRWIVSCRDLVLKDTGKPDSWSAMKELGLGGVEVRVDDDLSCPNLFHPTKNYSVATAAGIAALQEELAANKVVITAMGLFNRGSEWRTRKNVSVAGKLLPAAEKLGVKALRIDVQARPMNPDEFMPVAVKACKQMCDFAAGTQVIIGVENHSAETNDPAFLQRLLDSVDSKHIGITLDPNNFYWYGWPLQQAYAYYEKFAPRVVHTHCKNVRYPQEKREVRRPMDKDYLDHSAPIYDGDIDYRRVAKILRKSKYQGDLCLENECLHHFPAAQHLGVLKKEIALLKSIAAS